MNEKEAKQQILDQIATTRHMVVQMKAFILSNFNSDAEKMRRRALESVEATWPEKVVLHESVDPSQHIRAVARSFSWQLAYGQATWSLIGAGLIHPASENLVAMPNNQSWTTKLPGGSGKSSGWNFEELAMRVPQRVRLAPTLTYQGYQPLSDPDLYLKDLQIPNMTEGIEEAVRLAVKCFRNELYLPALAMLGSASEGAWIEMGKSLISYADGEQGFSSQTLDQKEETLQSPHESILSKIQLVQELYQRKDIFGEVAKQSAVRPKELDQIVNWSNIVRDARNALHYGKEANIPNTYESVATLLLAAKQHLRQLYAVMQAASELEGSTSKESGT